MSLVIAFIGKSGAVMAGDLREITFQGEKADRECLEKELYSGAIVTDESLETRAEELGVKITIRDNKNKVMERAGILVGEVSSFEDGVLRKRRLYASAGNYAIAEIRDSELTVSSKGKGSNFIVFGNDFTKQIAHKCFKTTWTKKSKLQDAVKIIIQAMETAAETTASVSKQYSLIQTTAKKDPDGEIKQDKKQLGMEA